MVLINNALKYSLRSGMVIPPEVLLLLRRVFTVLGFLLFKMNLRISLSIFVKNLVGNLDQDCIESVDCFR